MPLADSLYRLALRLISDPDAAQDVVQETYLRAYRTFDNFKTGTNAKAWLFTILYSIVRNRRRQSSRRPAEASLSQVEQTRADLPPTRGWGSHTEMLRGLEQQQVSREIVRVVRQMPEDWRRVFLLVVVEEMSYEEVASVLECAVGTIGSRLFRARRHLLHALAPVARDAGFPTEENA